MPEDRTARQLKANGVFTPGSPVNTRALFAGRVEQLKRVMDAIPAPGRHPIIYGKRGVGKTSLANIIREVVKGLISVKVSCDGSDTFATIWERAFRSATVTFKQKAFGFSRDEASKTTTLARVVGHDASLTTPAEIGEIFQRFDQWCVVVIDEFDKVADSDARRQLAELIKNISDNAPNVTLVIVGIAKDVHDLIGEHESIERNLVHVGLPAMSDDEIREIVDNGFRTLGLTADPGIIDDIPPLANGFPHYAHLIGLCCAKACIDEETQHLSAAGFHVACSRAVEDAIEKYRDAYSAAVTTAQISRYPQILCACSYAQHDDRGVFRATDVVDAMRLVFKETLTLQAVTPALGAFTAPDRGQVLRAIEVKGRKRYFFADPMMRPFLRLKTRDLIAG